MKLDVSPTSFTSDIAYDLAVITVGFERRSSYLLRRDVQASRIVAVAFLEVNEHSFASNLELARKSGADIFVSHPYERLDQLNAEWPRLRRLALDHSIRIAVDISSMTRIRLASTVLNLQSIADIIGSDVTVDFFYSPGLFIPPSLSLSGPLSIAPVLPEFSGRLRRTSLPLGGVVGLGYEPQRALGAFEWLEPNRAWAFSPKGLDIRFEQEVSEANRQLLDVLGPRSVFEYEVVRGADIVYALDSFVFAFKKQYRLVLLPMGPKIFSLACLLIGMDLDGDRPAVWRVGGVAYANPVEVVEEGEIVGVRVVFSDRTRKHA